MSDQQLTEVRVASAADVAEGDGVLARLDDGLEIGVFRVDGAVVAYENRCRHQGGPVCTGEIMGRYEQVLSLEKTVIREEFNTSDLHLVCPWHGWEYELETGVNAANPAYALRKVRDR